MRKTILNEGDEGVRLIIKDAKVKSTQKPSRVPVHVVYGGADRFSVDTPQKFGKIALATLAAYAPNFVEFASAMRLQGSELLPSYPKAMKELEKSLRSSLDKVKRENFAAWFAWTIYQKTLDKLKREPVEDFRIDFEDGYGFRSDEEEDHNAIIASDELAAAFKKNKVTPFCGFRIKSLGPLTYGRALKTLDLFLVNLFEKTGGKVPEDFVVTLPKVTDAKQVRELCKRLASFEKKNKLAKNSIGVELMIETPESIIDKKGRIAVRDLVDAAKGRCTSVHFGVYDYTAALGISASHQDIGHPACNFARHMMQAALANTGVRLVDSVTTEIPVAIHKEAKLSTTQIA
ncbi:MAG TPA: aldolase/citrate lyase family protein, partial [Pyrinomonadaceae bacterium]|nr:aldolase/citrate lyase family protein [Pyrinomonadaceae bacterium]